MTMFATGRCIGSRKGAARLCKFWISGDGEGRGGREADEKVRHVYASFGGLLLHIEGPHKRLSGLRHEYIYLLIKK